MDQRYWPRLSLLVLLGIVRLQSSVPVVQIRDQRYIGFDKASIFG